MRTVHDDSVRNSKRIAEHFFPIDEHSGVAPLMLFFSTQT